MGPKYTYEQLVEKIARARMMLEMKRPKHQSHSDRCMVELDPEYYGPCTCGATSSNSQLDGMFDDVIDELRL